VASALAQACCAWARYAVLRGSGGASKLARHGVAVVFTWCLRLRGPALYGCIVLGREALGREHPEGMTQARTPRISLRLRRPAMREGVVLGVSIRVRAPRGHETNSHATD
jgi:hypothetical protein